MRNKEQLLTSDRGKDVEKRKSEAGREPIATRTIQKGQIRQRVEKERFLCPVAKRCGGCQLQGMTYEEQLAQKQKTVRQFLSPFGRIRPILGMEDPYYYRNKVHAVFACDRRNGIYSGVYEAGSHRVVPVESCYLEDQKADAIVATIRELCKSFRIKSYDEDTGYGLLRHVLVRIARGTGEILVVLVLGSPILPAKRNFVKALRKEHPEITSVVLNINEKQTSMVLGEREEVLYGPGFIVDELCGMRFRISAKSFYQVNPVQTKVLYETALDMARLKKEETVLDAFCGIGTIGLLASKSCGQVTGVELNPQAIRDARENAKLNRVENIKFCVGDAGDYLRQRAEEKHPFDVVFLDPPRSGAGEIFCQALGQCQPKRIVSISCNLETLARDLRQLVKYGYRVLEIQPVDLFPGTEHVETVCLLSKLNVKQHIEVELSMDEMDLTAVETKASYEEIKAYVLEKFGMKVSHLYIAQVKRKCGIIERENYNKPKSEDSKQPQCPPEKEAAIRAALEHFQMIPT